MLPEFLKARLSAIVCGYGIILRLVGAHAEPWHSILWMTVAKAFGTAMMVTGFLCMVTYLIEGIIAMRKVKVEVKKVTEKPQK